MHPAIARYVEQVHDIVRRQLSPADCLREVAAAAQRLVADPLELGPEFRRVPKSGYGRNLVWRDPDSGVVLIAMAWPPGLRGAPHDHGTWGAVAVAEGSVAITNFARRDDGSRDGHAELVPVEELVAGRGAVATVMPPERDFHQVGNASAEEWAISLHTYGRDVRRCHMVDLDTGKMQEVEVCYTSVLA